MTAARQKPLGFHPFAIAAVIAFGLLLAPAFLRPASAADAAHPAFFAEPISGRKVTKYEIDLTLRGNQTRTFSIPQDCEAVMQTVRDAAAYRSSVMDRRFWLKAQNDCRYHALLNRHSRASIKDYISEFDFMNARLDVLPFDAGCKNCGAEDDAPACQPSVTNTFGQHIPFPLVDPGESDTASQHDTACRLEQGVFRGHITIDRAGLRCAPSEEAPGLRLVGVDYADINGDGVLDAVLRFLPIRGRHLGPLLLPLTRLEPDGPFEVPEQTIAPLE